MLALFRTLIVTNICLYVIALVWPLLDVKWLSEKELDVLSYIGYGAVLTVPNIVLWGLILAWFVIMIAMFFFVRWSRVAFVTWIAISMLLMTVSGLDVKHPIEAFLTGAGSTLDGAILAIAYFSTISGNFSKRE